MFSELILCGSVLSELVLSELVLSGPVFCELLTVGPSGGGPAPGTGAVSARA
ncbi:hypothetical protein KTU01_12850 [Kocuria turfanensis]|uniref:Uncharacterized protein n=1 Tax=Kocuria turfanensis TaxID=388357 RepID=A0A512IBT3_9MICC|nr:hypothetical protein KTU01_12850 [Kocuria turfanensis]